MSAHQLPPPNSATAVEPDAALPVVNIAAYKFAPLGRLPQRRRELRELAEALQLKGTILLSSEGINLFVAGPRAAIDAFLRELTRDPLLRDLEVKESLSDRQPFNRMLVRLKKEIIAFGVEVDLEQSPAQKLPPATLREWLDQGKPITLLDVRNRYEIELGTFNEAVDLKLDHFREFPEAVQRLPEAARERPIVMFCTGGIRCEKAGPLMKQRGFGEVWQLEGGILKYFEECGGAHWNGECFVFDQRVALAPDLSETETTQCYACQAPLSAADQRSPQYRAGAWCPKCYRSPDERLRVLLEARRQQLAAVTDPLPGSVPYDNTRPLSVPARYDRCPLLDVLDGLHPHVGRERWQQICEAGELLYRGEPATADRIVRSGERYHRKLGATVEPEVNRNVDFVWEDEAIVAVAKPAPLPMHPSGRFNRNTLIEWLNRIYAPQKLRVAHRLDANTSGLVVLARTRPVASRLQPQFAQGLVTKHYLARVHGTAPEERFRCEIGIGQPAAGGIRLPDAAGQRAASEFEVLARCGSETLLRCRPLTGRTNQLRIHLWHLGLPIVGDPAYLPEGQLGGNHALSLQQPPMQLHAERLAFRHPLTDQPLVLTVPPPAWAPELGGRRTPA